MDQSTQRTLLYAGAAIVVGYAAYQIYTSQTASASPSSSSRVTASSGSGSSSSSRPTPTPKKPTYTPKGDPESWSLDDMRKFLSSRNLGVGLDHASKQELLAMVESKLHEPTTTGGFDDPQEWSVEDLKDYLRNNGKAVGSSPSRMELLAMVEADMHAPQ